ncbi:MAG: hypothetical protein L0J74_02170 [Corynebacterium sp.]|uniref:hypothetical protein n=1 Tax=Corynebacterium TaxID=1716 RepID=UPI00264A41EB|nr:hypothetical protein [Corynebacterium sp.]MDN6283962.1 hypothetical protein [Corynebacterium sp.]MDN6304604.1 hypothetical protein [Corynebacterium sp.]MDN6352947.1 hypothetical protein [Corynebacterium sp.]MDN6368035.1 hypothetical protein [Corynebacterium sp.]MDN6375363.1 hypothetical protein [Corynebacterium sp.]
MRTLRPARRRPFAYPVVAAATAVLLGLGGLTACSSDDEPTEAPADVPVPGVAVTVLDAGEGEASPLVWFNDDTEQETTFHATRGLEQSTQGAPEEDDIPYEERTMEIPLTVSTDTDGEDLDATVVAGLPTGDNTDRNDDIATAEGFTMTQSYGQDGRVSSRSFSSPESASGSARASVEQSFTQMTDLPLVFPTEELGEGARWTVSSQVDDSISMRQTVTYTLMKREGSQIELDIDIDRTPSVRQLPGTDLQVVDSASDSGGRVTVDLRRPVPVSGMIETSTTVTFGEPDSDISVVQTSRTKSVWEPSSGEDSEESGD